MTIKARRLQERLASKVGEFFLETARARPCPQPLKRSAEGEARLREPSLDGYMKLRIEPWPGPRHLFMDLRDPRHNHLDDNVRGILEGVWYAASFGLEFGRPISPVKIEVVDAGDPLAGIMGNGLLQNGRGGVPRRHPALD